MLSFLYYFVYVRKLIAWISFHSVPYSVKMVVRVTAVNSAGEGKASEEHVISTPKGECSDSCLTNKVATIRIRNKPLGPRRFQALICLWKSIQTDSHVVGLYFHLDTSSANTELLILNNNNCTVSLKSPIYAFILGNVKISSGCHYWRVRVDQFSSPNQLSIIGKSRSLVNCSKKCLLLVKNGPVPLYNMN